MLRNGVRHGQHNISLFYGTPTPGNQRAKEQNALNRFSVTRQLHYSRTISGMAIDLALFINGLPVATFELKNSLTKQTAADAEQQYKRGPQPARGPVQAGPLHGTFCGRRPGGTLLHGAQGQGPHGSCRSIRGRDGGAGNPVNPDGLMTQYLWSETLSRESLTDILENYAQLIQTTDPKTGRRRRTQIWPRYHQLDVVRKLLTDAQKNGAGQRYLVQHSAGSGKSNSIAWLAHRLVGSRVRGNER